MICAWKQLLNVLPSGIRMQVESDGGKTLQELRLRLGSPPEMITADGSTWLSGKVGKEEMDFVVNSASQYSPWCTGTMSQGYLTIPGGHRIGICGSYVPRNGTTGGIQQISSLCIRVARDFPGAAKRASDSDGSILILGAPGWGKTTLLRDLARQISQRRIVCVVDERGELFPEGIPRGRRMDVLLGCPKTRSIEMTLRTMGPEYIAVDEITAKEDCDALVQAANCGVQLLATAHAYGMQDLRKRPLYQMLLERRIFQTFLLLHKDKSYCVERMVS